MLLLYILPLIWMTMAQFMAENWRIQNNLVTPVDGSGLMFNLHSNLKGINSDNILIDSSIMNQVNQASSASQKDAFTSLEQNFNTFTHQIQTPNHESWNNIEDEYRKPMIEISQQESNQIINDKLKNNKEMNIKIDQSSFYNTKTIYNVNQIDQQTAIPIIPTLPKSSKILRVNDFPNVSAQVQLFKGQNKQIYGFNHIKSGDQMAKHNKLRNQDEYLSDDSDLASKTEKILFTSFISTLIRSIQLLDNTNGINQSSTYPNTSLQTQNSLINLTVVAAPQNQSLTIQNPFVESAHSFDSNKLQNFKLNQDQNLFQLQQYDLKMKHFRKKKIYFVICTMSFGIISILLIKRSQSKSLAAQTLHNRDIQRRIRLPSEEIQQI